MSQPNRVSTLSVLPCPHCGARLVLRSSAQDPADPAARETRHGCDGCGTELIRPTTAKTAAAA